MKAPFPYFGGKSRVAGLVWERFVTCQMTPARYPIRNYPDITHSRQCQFPAPGWDPAFSVTEARETINPRPLDMARIFRLDIATGKRDLWKELTPPDSAGISNVAPPAIAADGKTYAYSYNRILSDLFLAEGVK